MHASVAMSVTISFVLHALITNEKNGGQKILLAFYVMMDDWTYQPINVSPRHSLGPSHHTLVYESEKM